MEKIGLDLDGVLYSFVGALETYCRINKGFNGSSFDFAKNIHIYWEKYQLEWLVDSPDIYYRFIPDERLLAFINKLGTKYRIYYITSRPKAILRTTQKYLRDFNFPQKENLIFAKDKDTYARYLGIDYFVEDNVEMAERLSKTCMSFLLKTPYNEDAEGSFIKIESIFDLERTLL